MSVNQINAQIKLMEIWKFQKIKDYPLELKKQAPKTDSISTRACTKGRLVEVGRSNVLQNTCISDAIKLWNRAPVCITTCESFFTAKKEIRNQCDKIELFFKRSCLLNFRTKECQILGKCLGYLQSITFLSKTAVATFGSISITFYN